MLHVIELMNFFKASPLNSDICQKLANCEPDTDKLHLSSVRYKSKYRNHVWKPEYSEFAHAVEPWSVPIMPKHKAQDRTRAKMAGSEEEFGNKSTRLSFAQPTAPETALARLQRWNLMNTVPVWLLPKISSAFVTKDLETKKDLGFLITETDEILVVGDNATGLLALDPAKIPAAKLPVYNEELSGKKIIDIKNLTSSSTIAARTSDGKIFTWGSNKSGIQGLGHPNATSGCSQVKGHLVENPVVSHCCSGFDTLCLTRSGKLVGWGSQAFPNISGAAPAHHSPFVMTWLPPAPITWIGATNGCFYALTTSGEVFSWGVQEQGQEASERTANAWIPTKVELPPEVRVMKVSCGYQHVLLLSTDNKLFTWGANNFGQVGNGAEGEAPVILPQLIELEDSVEVEDILAVGAGNVSFCKTSKGVIYQWGDVKGGKVLAPIATGYRSFDDALIVNDVGMSSMWTRSSSPAEVQFRYKTVFEASSGKKLMFYVCGTKLEARGREFAVCRSSAMRRMIETDWKELVADEKPIELEHVQNLSMFLSLMMYMQTDEIVAADEDLLDLVRLANRFEVYELGRKSAKRLQALITESNAMDIYQVARECGAMGLVLVALDTISGFFWEIGLRSGRRYDPLLYGQLVSDLQDLNFGPKLKRPCD